MDILVSGSTGLVGRQLVRQLKRDGHRITPLVRRRQTEGVLWDPNSGEVDTQGMEGYDAVFHLAGENIAEGRWSPAKKERIRHSRVEGTRLLSRAIASLQQPPKTFVSASAVGFYGDRGEERCDESSDPGTGFLAETCIAWEEATQVATEAGVRVVLPRLGIVLSKKGGALGKMLLPFKLGMGARLGEGHQFMSWISERDLIDLLTFCLSREELFGPVNAVAPLAVTNREFTRTLAKVLKRPACFAAPAWVLKTVLGEMAREMLLSGAHVVPSKLTEAGFVFQDPDLTSALQFLLNDSSLVS
jgi:uncharacterized protein (TIGR01777 family)